MAYRIPAQTFDGVEIPDISFYISPVETAQHINTSDISSVLAVNSSSTEKVYFAFNNATASTVLSGLVSAAEISGAKYGPTANYGGLRLTHTYTYDQKTVYYRQDAYQYADSSFTALVEAYRGALTNEQWQRIAWLMVYGGYEGFSITYDLTNCTGAPGNPTVIAPNQTITTANFTPNNPEDGFTTASCWIDGTGYPEGPVVFTFTPETGALRIGPVSSDIIVYVEIAGDPYDGEGTGGLGGGSVGLPGLPGLTATSTGIVGLFAPSTAQMQLLASFMWTDFGGQGTTEIDVLKEIVEAFKRSIANPLDYVLGLNIIPSQGLSVAGASEIRFGFTNTGVSMPRLSNQYFTVDCGSLSFDAVCGDTFLDYAPYSKFSIYLPYIGIKELDANDCVGHTIGVQYHGDTVTGGLTAYITKDGSVMYQFSGCCALNIPLSADNWGNTISAAVNIATAIGAGAVSGGAAGIAKAAAQGAASVAANPSLLSPQVQHSGAVSGGAGCMGVQYPFIIREAVRFHSTAGFNRTSGYPSYYFRSLSAVHGYTKVLEVHLQSIPATQDEIAEIESILKEGAIF